jgi:hypothetical protein
MGETQTMRASDRDRQQVVDRLRGAVEDGRLTMDEYMQRMELAYRAVTYGELAPLQADLPATGSVHGQGREPDAASPRAAALWPAALWPAAQGATAPGATARRSCFLGFVAGLPGVLRVLWATWLTAVAINVVVWALVSGTTGHLIYPWPLWVAGPYGTALVAVSAVVAGTQAQRRLGR